MTEIIVNLMYNKFMINLCQCLSTEKAKMVSAISMPTRNEDLITIDSSKFSCDSVEIILPLDVNSIGI